MAQTAPPLADGSRSLLDRPRDTDCAGPLAAQRPVADVGTCLASEKSQEVAEALNPLSRQGGCPTLRVPRAAFSCMQTLLSALQTSYGGKAVHGIMVLRSDYLIWSTLSLKVTND